MFYGGKGKKQQTVVVSSGDNTTEASSVSVKESEPTEENLDSDYFDCQIFWDIAQDENQSSSFRTKELALNSLIEVLKTGYLYNHSIRNTFINQSLDNMKKGKTVYFTL